LVILHSFYVPHSLHELLFNEADFPVFIVQLQIRQVVAAIDIDGIELEITGTDTVLLKPFIKQEIVFLQIAGELSPDNQHVFPVTVVVIFRDTLKATFEWSYIHHP